MRQGCTDAQRLPSFLEATELVWRKVLGYLWVRDSTHTAGTQWLSASGSELGGGYLVCRGLTSWAGVCVFFQGSGRLKVSVLTGSARRIQGILGKKDVLRIRPNDAGPASRKLHPDWEGHGTQPVAHHSLLKS